MYTREVLTATLLSISAVCAAAAPELTERERAAASQRPATPEETARWRKECALDFSGPQAPDFAVAVAVAGVTPRRAALPELRVVTAISYVRDPRRDEERIIQHRLPNGGIAGADFCDMSTVAPTRGAPPAVIGPRLRSGLDLTRSYPASMEMITAEDLLVSLPARDWLIYDVGGNDMSEAIAARFAAHPLLTTVTLDGPEGAVLAVQAPE